MIRKDIYQLIREAAKPGPDEKMAEKRAIIEWLRLLRYYQWDIKRFAFAKARAEIAGLYPKTTLHKLIHSGEQHYATAVDLVVESGEYSLRQIEWETRKAEARRRVCLPYGNVLLFIGIMFALRVPWLPALIAPPLLFIFMNEWGWRIMMNRLMIKDYVEPSEGSLPS